MTTFLFASYAHTNAYRERISRWFVPYGTIIMLYFDELLLVGV